MRYFGVETDNPRVRLISTSLRGKLIIFLKRVIKDFLYKKIFFFNNSFKIAALILIGKELVLKTGSSWATGVWVQVPEAALSSFRRYH